MRRLAAILGVSLCAGAAAHLALLMRDTPALSVLARHWGLVAVLGTLALVQALRSVRPWAAAGPVILAMAAVLVYLKTATPQSPIASVILGLGVGLIGLVLVVAASGNAARQRAASCTAILRSHRSRADNQLTPELHAMAVVGMADWDLSTTSLNGPTDLNVTVAFGQVVIRLPAACTWSTDEPVAGFWHQLRVFVPADADAPPFRARRGRAASTRHVQIHVLAIAGSVHVIAPRPSATRAALTGPPATAESEDEVESAAHP